MCGSALGGFSATTMPANLCYSLSLCLQGARADRAALAGSAAGQAWEAFDSVREGRVTSLAQPVVW